MEGEQKDWELMMVKEEVDVKSSARKLREVHQREEASVIRDGRREADISVDDGA
jgi:PHD/YefM family antitoxin component YafN of YafNO toxin-antitoxin module